MKCPNCGKTVGEHDGVCSNCGIALPEIIDVEDTSIVKKFSHKKEKAPLGTTKPSGADKLRRKMGGRKGKLILIGVAVILLVVLVILIIVSLSSSKGRKIADKTMAYIGADIGMAEKDADVHFKDESAYKGLNNAVKYDYIYESDDDVKVDGITYPEWAVLVTVNENEKIDSVKYSNFKTLKADVNGKERDKVVNLDKFETGVSGKTVLDEIDLDYYSITYTKDTISYVYRYWYTTADGDKQPVVLNVSFDRDNDYLYYSSTLVYPAYM